MIGAATGCGRGAGACRTTTRSCGRPVTWLACLRIEAIRLSSLRVRAARLRALFLPWCRRRLQFRRSFASEWRCAVRNAFDELAARLSCWTTFLRKTCIPRGRLRPLGATISAVGKRKKKTDNHEDDCHPGASADPNHLAGFGTEVETVRATHPRTSIVGVFSYCILYPFGSPRLISTF